MKRALAIGFVMLVTAILAPAAPAAAGAGPSGAGKVPLGLESPNGVVSSTSAIRYVARRRGRRTDVLAIATGGGRTVASRRLPGRWGVPAVSLDGTPTGLSADDSALVLAETRARFPRPRSRLVILDGDNLRLRERITLRGDFSVDAVSPDGSTLYLIENLSPNDPTNPYLVRAYDVIQGRLLPEPIVDPREPNDRMQGYAITRVSSPDGRWAYTLYDRPQSMPFIHALDTSERRAVCIDLGPIPGIGDYAAVRMDLGAGGRRLSLLVRGRPQAVIDTRTFRVSDGTPERRTSEQGAAGDGRGANGVPWLLLAGAAAGVIAALGLALRRSAASPTPDVAIEGRAAVRR